MDLDHDIYSERFEGGAQENDTIDQNTMGDFDTLRSLNHTQVYSTTQDLPELNKLQAKTKLALESECKVDKRYKTLFMGLRRDPEKLTALTQPILFCVRRIVFAFLVVFTYKTPMFAIGALQFTVLMNISFIIQEKPWKDNIVNK